MHIQGKPWGLMILDADPPVTNLVSMATGDIDGDGSIEIITGGGPMNQR